MTSRRDLMAMVPMSKKFSGPERKKKKSLNKNKLMQSAQLNTGASYKTTQVRMSDGIESGDHHLRFEEHNGE